MDFGLLELFTNKELLGSGIDETKEIEITVGDFEQTNLLLEKLGYTP